MSDLSKQYHSIDISGRNTWDYWHLVPSSRPLVNPPEIEENIIKIPGRDGFINMSQIITGDTSFGQRTGSWEFIAHPDYAQSEPWQDKYSDIMRYLHGRTHTVILEDDPYFYYEGWLKVNQWKSDSNWSTITIDYVLQPYKKSILYSDEGWLWDPFNFLNGYADELNEVAIDGTLEVPILGSTEKFVPTITASIEDGNSLTVTFDGETYSLVDGENRISEMIFEDRENLLTFNGTGVVSIRFKRGWL